MLVEDPSDLSVIEFGGKLTHEVYRVLRGTTCPTSRPSHQLTLSRRPPFPHDPNLVPIVLSG